MKSLFVIYKENDVIKLSDAIQESFPHICSDDFVYKITL